MSVNKVIVLGNLGKDPIVRKLESGKSVAQFTLATNERYRDKSDQIVTQTEWHNIVLWSPLAEIAEKYLKKGSQVYIEGKIKSREYQDKEGISRRIVEIEGRELTLLGGPNSSGDGNTGEQANTGSMAGAKAETAMVMDDDLPF